jgi:hypothetical protein
MDKRKRKNRENLLHEFRAKKADLGPIILAFIFLIAFYLILIPYFAGRDASFIVTILIITIFICPFVLWYTSWLNRHPAILRIYKDGIEYEHRSKILFSSWDNLNDFQIERISTRRGDSLLPLLVLYREAEVISVATGFDKSFIREHSDFFIPLYGTVEVPLRMKNGEKVVNREALQETEFGQYLLKYAPHLFEEIDHETQKNQQLHTPLGL